MTESLIPRASSWISSKLCNARPPKPKERRRSPAPVNKTKHQSNRPADNAPRRRIKCPKTKSPSPSGTGTFRVHMSKSLNQKASSWISSRLCKSATPKGQPQMPPAPGSETKPPSRSPYAQLNYHLGNNRIARMAIHKRGATPSPPSD